MLKRRTKLQQLKSLKAPKIKKIQQKLEDDDQDEDISDYKSDDEEQKQNEEPAQPQDPDTQRKVLAKQLLKQLENEGQDAEQVLEDAVKPPSAQTFTPVAHCIQLKDKSSYYGHKKAITTMDVSKDGANVYTGSKDCCIINWDINTGKKDIIRGEKGNDKIDGHSADILSVCVSADGKSLLSSGKDKTIKLWDIHNKKLIHTFKGHRDWVSAVCFDTETECFYSVSADKAFKIWHSTNRALLDTYYGHKSMATSIVPLMKDRVLSCGTDDLAIQWKVHEESQLLYSSKIGSMDKVIKISNDTFAACGEESGMCMWTLNKRTPILTHCNLHEAPSVTSMAYLYGTDVITTGSYDNKINIYSLSEDKKKILLKSKLDVNGSINDMKWVGNNLFLVQSREQKYGRWVTFKEVDDCITILRFEY